MCLEQTTTQRKILGQLIQTTKECLAWQQEARIYIAWRDQERGEQMRQYRDILKLEPVQERIAQIRQAQEQVRLAQEKGRQKLETLETLGNWKQIAINLERSDGYVQRIQEITDDYRRSKPLKENQIKAINYDFSAYREQRREAQVQRQRQQGFSL